MSVYILQRELHIRRPLAAVFSFFAQPENLERITPPWLGFRILTPTPIQMQQGTQIAYALRIRGIPVRWLGEIQRWNPPFEFVDVQVKGPYKFWRHQHLFSETQDGTSMVDIVEYALPLGPVGRLAHRLRVAQDLADIFDYRAQCVHALLG